MFSVVACIVHSLERKWMIWGILAEKDELGNRPTATVGIQKTGAQKSRKHLLTRRKFNRSKKEIEMYT